MDIVYIKELEIDAIIGVYDWEREVHQRLSLDLEMAWDIRAAARDDDIAQALNYKDVAKRLTGYVQASEFQVLEALAERIAALVMEEFSVLWLRLRISKPGAVRGSRDVGLVIERGEWLG